MKDYSKDSGLVDGCGCDCDCNSCYNSGKENFFDPRSYAATEPWSHKPKPHGRGNIKVKNVG